MRVVFNVAVAVWLAFELTLQLRERLRATRAEERHDRGTYRWLGLGIGGGVALGIAFSHRHGWAPDLRYGVGTALVLAGLVLRVWAVRTLGVHFRLVVVVSEGQQIVERGPYRVLRHPSYAALLLCLLGLAVGYGSIPSLLVVLLPLAALLRRIRVEEAALTAAFGDSYRDYARRTWRLVPGIW